MSGKVDARLKELGIELPTPPAPVASYVPYVISGKQVYISGQVTMEGGALKYVGIVGKEISLDDAKAAARLCAINLLAQLKAAAGGDLDKVARCVKLGVFVNCVPGFDKQPEVANGASDLIVEVLGDKGVHARSAVGVAVLPLDAPVEVEIQVELTGA